MLLSYSFFLKNQSRILVQFTLCAKVSKKHGFYELYLKFWLIL